MSVLRLTEAEVLARQKRLGANSKGSRLPAYQPEVAKPAKALKSRPTGKPEASEGEETLAMQLSSHRIRFQREYRFDAVRRWRFDFAMPDKRLAIEVEGGTWINGRHNRGSSMEAELEKYNAAAIQGWTVLRFTTSQVKRGEAVKAIIGYLG